MRVDIWSDFMCPFCYIGKRRFEEALSRFPHKDKVEVVFRSFELDPGAKRSTGQSMDELLAAKYGMTVEQAREANENVTRQAQSVGLEYHLDTSVPTNSFDAHRLTHLAAQHNKGYEMAERLFRAHFTESRDLGDRTVLTGLAAELGIPEEEASAALESGEFTSQVRSDEAEAASLGIRGVPFFVLNNKFAVSGAQPVELFLEALNKAQEDEKPLVVMGDQEGGDAACVDGSCQIPESK
ncbi:DSBA oxidoreductase [Paenibacillus sp. J31TS4]|uniref:DsbA family oxidoreductase n=1 Tax=Paenibacillus sp. J31TS4 TaxID=2807195 RepID=UPI001B2AFE12|nr:DsbA family oxidoreductase [Paenibacillus sp. J31TS4]GIP40133.1 DSBA oxidoreductase [Paenibacillus sp. J31TS4]